MEASPNTDVEWPTARVRCLLRQKSKLTVEDELAINRFVNSITPMLITAVRRHRRLFVSFPEIDFDDMTQESLIFICKSSPPDLRKASTCTYINLIVQRRMLTLHRTMCRRANRIALAAANN